jgi:hypothetical protein
MADRETVPATQTATKGRITARQGKSSRQASFRPDRNPQNTFK